MAVPFFRAADSFFLGLLFACLLPHAWNNLSPVIQKTPQDLAQYVSTSREERRLNTYGTWNYVGYGYLKKIVQGIPAPEFFPATKYASYPQNAHLLFPSQRTQIDSRLLAGIGLQTEDLLDRPAPISPIRIPPPQLANLPPGAQIDAWAFTTQNDYDTLTAVQCTFPEGTKPSQFSSIQFTLVEGSNTDRRVLTEARWDGSDIPESFIFRLKSPYRSFSLNHGNIPFILLAVFIPKANGERVPAPLKLILHTIKIDLTGYQIIHREKGCFTAIQSAFLTDIQNRGDAAWIRYLRSLENADV